MKNLLIVSACLLAAKTNGLPIPRLHARYAERQDKSNAWSGISATNQRRSGGLKRVVPWGGVRGGDACEETNAAIAIKAGVSAILETAGLLGVIAGAKSLVSHFKIPLLGRVVGGLPILQWASLALVIFRPSTVKDLIDGSVSAASSQTMNPSAVPGQGSWYANLKKPWFNPPGWIFPIMWLVISKPTQLVALSKIMKSVSPTPWWPALTVYCAHLSLGDAWNDVFFGCERIGLGAGVISTFYGALLTSSMIFSGLNTEAGRYMLPTCGWVTVATALNLSIYRLNPSNEKDD